MKVLTLIVALTASVAFVMRDDSAGAQSAKSRVIDRTFLCKPVVYGGLSDVDLIAGPPLTHRFGADSAHLIARTGTTLPNQDLVLVRHQAQAEIGCTNTFPGPAGVYANAHRCIPARAKMQLSSEGFSSPSSRFATDRTCSIRGRIVVRVRTRLAAATKWRRGYEPFLVGARGRVVEASLAVRAASSGASLAYMTVDRVGSTRFWSSPRCS